MQLLRYTAHRRIHSHVPVTSRWCFYQFTGPDLKWVAVVPDVVSYNNYFLSHDDPEGLGDLSLAII